MQAIDEEVHPFSYGVTKCLKEQSDKIKTILKSKQQWQDDLFPPDENSIFSGETEFSLTYNPDYYKQINPKAVIPKTKEKLNYEFIFQRLSEVLDLKEYNLLKEPKDLKTNPTLLSNDIIQGELSDNYLLSALSVLAESPGRIKRLFNSNTLNSQGCVEVNCYLHGEPTIILLDDYIVVKTLKEEFQVEGSSVPNKIAFAQISSSKNVWPLFLEKAFAKIHLNYENICSGDCTDALEFFSPAPIETFYHSVLKSEIFPIIKNALEKNLIVMCDINCPSNSKEFKMLKSLGLVTNHAYSVIDTAELSDIKGKSINLIKVKNKWGTNEWEGDWSDKSTKWTESFKKALNLEEKEDGIFWISAEDYLKFYTTTYISYEKENYYYQNARLTFDNQKPVNFFKIKIPQNCNGSIVVNQKNSRIYKTLKKENANHYGSMLVFKYEKGKVVALGNDSGKKNRMFVNGDFNKGDYFVALNFPFNNDYPVKDEPSYNDKRFSSEVFEFSVGVGFYSSSSGVVIEDIPEDNNDVKEFFIDYISSDAQSKEKHYFDEEGEKDSFRVPFFDQKSAYGYIYYENNSDGFINEVLTFTELQNISIMPLLRRGKISSFKEINKEEDLDNEEHLNILASKADLNSKYEITQDIKKGKKIDSKNSLQILITIAPRSSGTILLEKNSSEAKIDFDSDLVITYPLHYLLSDESKFKFVKQKVKYNNKNVDIVESILEHNNGVLIKYKNKTRNLVFASHLKFYDMKNISIKVNSDELLKEAQEIMKKDENEELETFEPFDNYDFNINIKNQLTECALYLEPGEVKFVQLEAENIFDGFSYCLDSTFYINLKKQS